MNTNEKSANYSNVQLTNLQKRDEKIKQLEDEIVVLKKEISKKSGSSKRLSNANRNLRIENKKLVASLKAKKSYVRKILNLGMRMMNKYKRKLNQVIYIFTIRH